MNAYEHPERIKERIRLAQPGDAFPHATRTRAKTHLAYRCTRLPTGEVLWRTPHGLHRIVDHLGTRVIDDYEANVWLSEDPVDRKVAHAWHRYKTGRDPVLR